MNKSILCLLFLWTFFHSQTVAQTLTVVNETDRYTEYEVRNADHVIAPYFELTIPYRQDQAFFEVLAQKTVRKERGLTEDQRNGFVLSDIDTPVFEILNKGRFRGQETVNLLIHVSRANTSETVVTEYLRFRIPKSTSSQKNQLVQKTIASDHPLSSGQWVKINIPKQGIYQINRAYLESAGFNMETVDPRTIQIWGTDGLELPEINTAERSEFKQFPILIEGENDGSFDTNDRLIFYGTTPDKIGRNSTGFFHQIHAFSTHTYVYLTVGESNGLRLSPVNNSMNATETISTFQDFIWLEEELNKGEDRQKTGRYWLGERIPATAQNQPVSIFKDTLAGVISSTPIRLSGKILARALNTTSYTMALNGTVFNQFSISRVNGGYTSYSGDAAKSSSFTNIPVSTSIQNNLLEITLEMRNGDNGANAYVDFLRLIVERSLTAENNRLLFFPPEGGNPSSVARYSLNGFNANPIVLDITNPQIPKLIEAQTSGESTTFSYLRDENRQILAQSVLYTPPASVPVANQNLKGITYYPDYIVVTNEFFSDYANELANHRQNDGLTPVVVTQNQILNEFSGGALDPTAIRDYMKFLWDRALADGQRLPKYLLLFGDTTYDTKNIVANSFTNYVLTFQSSESLSRIGSYGSDDYFGFMDDGEGAFVSNSRIDIGIGRIPAQTRSEAAIALEKIYRYEDPATFGDWQNLFAFAGDDDFPDRTLNRDLHVWNADGTADRMNIIEPGLRLKKIYLFAYQEEITGAGRQLPGATQDFINTINNGALVMNYSGHGNTKALTDEELFTTDYIPDLTNSDKLSLFVTATCQFGRYDDINAQSGAELLLFARNGGAIASFTTTRIVYTSSEPDGRQNFALNIALSQQMLVRDELGLPSRLGDIYLRTKNTAAGASSNSRRFILLGDPALRIALPKKAMNVQSINDFETSVSDSVLTLKGLDKVTISGSITDATGNPDGNFNGEATISLFDAKREVTIPQDLEWVESRGCYLYRGTPRECKYEVETDLLFKGKTLVENGRYKVELVIPKDISFSGENGRIVVFAQSEQATAGGSFTNVAFNGINENAVNDGKGPNLDVFLNDESFFNGDLSGNTPTLIIELADSSGINTTGTGVGHEITATIDTKPSRTVVLNDFYEGTLNDFSSGRIEYPLEEIPQGSYSLKVRAWDVHNNPSEESIFFEIAENEKLVIDQVYNYPNPMNNYTAFTFEHNQQGNPLEVDIRIYTLSGKPVQHVQQIITNTSSSYASIPWNGRDRDNDRLGNGTYIYVLRVTTDTPEGRRSTEKIEKLVVIR